MMGGDREEVQRSSLMYSRNMVEWLVSKKVSA